MSTSPNIPPKEIIDKKVIDIIKKVAVIWGRGSVPITKTTRFFEDLGFAKLLVRELATPLYGRIIKKYGGSRMSKAEAGKFKTVGDACKLVYKKIKS